MNESALILVPVAALVLAGLGVAFADPATILDLDRRTGRAIYEAAPNHEAGLAAAGRFYRVLGLGIAAFALLVGSMIFTMAVAGSRTLVPPAIGPAAPAVSVGSPSAGAGDEPAVTSLHQLSVRRLDGTREALSRYRGKVALVVNTASECGYTPQYEGLEALYQRRRAEGFVVLGFPSNDFGGQEPGSSGEIAAFCQKTYGVTFPLFEKVVTKGAGASPVYQLLAQKHGAPAWNFHKYLVGKDGAVRAAFPSAVTPKDAQLADAIDKALAD